MEQFYQAIYSGELLQFDSNEATRNLLKEGIDVVKSHLALSPQNLSAQDFREALSKAREVFSEERFFDAAKACLLSFGLDLSGLYLDQIRLRALTPGLQDIPEAAPVFYCHRDSWYGNPKCQVNVWLPLQDVDGRNSFRFFPDYFAHAIQNDSETFVAQQFLEQGGFGRVSPVNSSVYPRALVEPAGETFDVEMSAGQMLFFSASHLHQSLVNTSGQIRLSLDFRFYRQDHLAADLGAPDPDNRSLGLLVGAYRSCS